LVAENFEDPINVVLCAAALVSVIIGIAKEGFPEGLTEGLSIMIALVIIIVVNSANNYASERQLAKMVELADEGEIAVYRGSNDTTTIPNSELVVGDVFEFSFGIKLPADCILIEGQNVVCDEVELTGEPHGIDKVPVTEENYREGAMSSMLAKSLVQSGFGKALVVAVGPNTVAGIISSKTMKPSEPTLLQKKLETIASKIGNVGIGCAILTFFSLIVRDALEMYKILPCGC
jgi:magnesium-transporting ATPase (P-type)